MNTLGYGIVLAVVTALAALVLGIRLAWRMMRNMREPRPVEGTLLWWEENPASPFRQDPLVASLSVAHRSAVLAMGVLAATAGVLALQAPPDWLPPGNPWAGSAAIWLVVYATVILGIGLAWFTLGATLALPIADRRLRPVRVVLAEEGIYWGQHYTPWDMFGPVRQDSRRGLIHLASSKSQGFVALTLKPPSGDLLANALELIQAREPTNGVLARTGSLCRRLGFGLVYVMTALPLVLLGLWLYPSTPLWACAAQGFGAWLATWLGARVILAYHSVAVR